MARERLVMMKVRLDRRLPSQEKLAGVTGVTVRKHMSMSKRYTLMLGLADRPCIVIDAFSAYPSPATVTRKVE